MKPLISAAELAERLDVGSADRRAGRRARGLRAVASSWRRLRRPRRRPGAAGGSAQRRPSSAPRRRGLVPHARPLGYQTREHGRGLRRRRRRQRRGARVVDAAGGRPPGRRGARRRFQAAVAAGLPMTAEPTTVEEAPPYPTSSRRRLAVADRERRPGRRAAARSRSLPDRRPRRVPLSRRERSVRSGAGTHPGRGQPAVRRQRSTPRGGSYAADEVRRRFERTLDGRAASDTIVYCGSGVTACHALLAMAHAGLDGAGSTWGRGASGAAATARAPASSQNSDGRPVGRPSFEQAERAPCGAIAANQRFQTTSCPCRPCRRRRDRRRRPSSP